MKIVVLILRILLGLGFTVFGILGFVMQPDPSTLPPLVQAMAESGYMIVMVKIVELLCGLLILSGRWVPLALVLLGPVMVNIVLFHLFLAPADGLVGYVFFLIWLFLGWAYRGSYSGMLAANAQPTV